MSRKLVEVETLHGFTIEKLVDIKNKINSNYSKLVLTSVIMRYNDFSTKEIKTVTGKSNITTIKHVRNWNKYGLKALEDHRGGSEGTFTAEMEADLINTLLTKTPEECGFVSYNWTCGLLAEYIYQNYGEKYSNEWIRLVLHKNKISYKRAQAKPTKADKAEQEAFKKNIKITIYFRDRR